MLSDTPMHQERARAAVAAEQKPEAAKETLRKERAMDHAISGWAIAEHPSRAGRARGGDLGRPRSEAPTGEMLKEWEASTELILATLDDWRGNHDFEIDLRQAIEKVAAM